MKNMILSVAFVGCIAFQSCKSTLPSQGTASAERCKGVPTLAWQEEIRGADAAKSAKIVAELTAKAQADAKKSEDLKGSAVLDGGLKSEFANAINQNVSASSKVSEAFWEQENTFTRLHCLSLSLLDRTDLTADQKAKIVDDIREMQKAEATYALNKEKKSGNNPR